MAIKDILLHMDASPRCAARLALALRLAATHGAHLTGLHVVELPPAAAFNGYPTGMIDVERIETMLEAMRAARLAEAATVEAGFRAALAREDVAGEWRIAEGEADELVALHGRYADLVIAGQPAPAELASARGAADLSPTALMAAGRPILMLPYTGEFPDIGRHALVGWNGSAEAARAVNAAIPLLARAQRVTVLAINPRRGLAGDGDLPAADMALHLARHGIRAEAAHTVAVDIGEGDALLSYAADLGADLLVCGMYGRSHLREQLFGGVTRSLLTQMTLPVFMSH